jgi:hypothetical protein
MVDQKLVYFPAPKSQPNPFPKQGILTGNLVRLSSKPLDTTTRVVVLRGKRKGQPGYIKGDYGDSLKRGLYRFVVYFDNPAYPCEIYRVGSFKLC